MIPWPHHPAFDKPLSELKGLSESGRKALQKKGLVRYADLLELPPLRYQDLREEKPLCTARDGESIFFTGVITDMTTLVSKNGRPYLRFTIEDTSDRGAAAYLMFFHGLHYFANVISPGSELAVAGRPTFTWGPSVGGRPEAVPTFMHPEFWNLARVRLPDLRGVYPVYGTVRSLTPALRTQYLKTILNEFKGGVPPVLSRPFLERCGLKDPTELIRILHEPPGAPGGRIPKSARETKTYRALALWELVFWRLTALREKSRRRELACERPQASGHDLGEDFACALPFALSPEQSRVLGEIRGILSLPSPANILLQGEVGSGKTAVAAALLFKAAGEGRQGALCAPTDLLARQHFDFLLPYCQRLQVGAELFCGSNPASKKKKTLEALASGEIRLAVGTQALFSPRLAFRNLALAVVDEQHRFGVKQRYALREKSPEADLISMSATPIPRSLALAFYGEMDIVSIQGTLPGRSQPEVSVYPSEQASEAYGLFAELIRSGERGFLVSPRIGDRDESQGSLQEEDPENPPEKRGPSVEDMAGRLSAIAPDVSFGIIHGKLAQAERARVMGDFREGRLQALVCTTIIEVGVDVPGVNVMLIVGAENMGLAQLHQLRGRLGRAGGAGRLILLSHGTPTERAERRFEALRSGLDGYALSELDLRLRGPGEDMGLKQSGWPRFSFVKLPRDLKMMDRAFELADGLFGERGEFPEEFRALLDEQESKMASEALGV
ncbi:MAG: DEAD/DEAH box helicase [Deltaproteobacteria bacterium]|jgi:ATP-dependent DNA helicase RecG|nr:DEAD/DEAH box helicase [Deltaproteobacteria bacterium]